MSTIGHKINTVTKRGFQIEEDWVLLVDCDSQPLKCSLRGKLIYSETDLCTMENDTLIGIHPFLKVELTGTSAVYENGILRINKSFLETSRITGKNLSAYEICSFSAEYDYGEDSFAPLPSMRMIACLQLRSTPETTRFMLNSYLEPLDTQNQQIEVICDEMSILVNVDDKYPSTVQSKPAAVWNESRKRLLWKILAPRPGTNMKHLAQWNFKYDGTNSVFAKYVYREELDMSVQDSRYALIRLVEQGQTTWSLNKHSNVTVHFQQIK